MQQWVTRELFHSVYKRITNDTIHRWPEFWRVVSEEQVILRSNMQRLRVIPPRTPSSPRLAYYRAKNTIRQRLRRESIHE